MLRRLAEAHGPRLAEAGLHLGIETPERLGAATDPDAVEQIVLNLLDNVCKYAAEGGEVLMRLESAASGARLAVADRGPGVPAEQRERIFEKFHRVDDRLTAEKPGAGLGLSIARQLARGLGGDLVCRAREGGGAEFVLTLS
jgi:signal transduction histidine kinase